MFYPYYRGMPNRSIYSIAQIYCPSQKIEPVCKVMYCTCGTRLFLGLSVRAGTFLSVSYNKSETKKEH